VEEKKDQKDDKRFAVKLFETQPFTPLSVSAHFESDLARCSASKGAQSCAVLPLQGI
jgi:hypothetical protein